MSKRMWDENEIIKIAEEHGGEGGGAVKSVNGKTGAVVLKASDIKATNAQTIQANLERIDSEINRVEGRFDNYVTLSELDEKGYMDEDSVEAKVESYHDESKQDKLTAGDNITIVGNVISATGGDSSLEFFQEHLDWGEAVIGASQNHLVTDILLQAGDEEESSYIEVSPHDIRLDGHRIDIVGVQDDVVIETLEGDINLNPQYGGVVNINGAEVATKEYVDDEISRVEGEIPSVEGLASQQYVVNKIAEEAVHKQDKLDSWSSSASVSDNKLTINYKVRQEDGSYEDVPVIFTPESSEPDAYIKSASATTTTLTLTKKDGSTVTFTPTPSNMVTTTATQSITGAKTFTNANGITVASSNGITVTQSTLLKPKHKIVGSESGSGTYTHTLPTKDGTFAMTDDIPDVSGKLDIVSTAGTYSKAYTVDKDGNQAMMNIGEAAEGWSIAKRTSFGQLVINAPTADSHAATKKYVDDAVGTSETWTFTLANGSIVTKDVKVG